MTNYSTIQNEIAQGINVQRYKHHDDPKIRALVAASDHAAICHIIDRSPEVRLALVETGKWLNRIAPNETDPTVILALVKQGIVHRRWERINNPVVQQILENIANGPH